MTAKEYYIKDLKLLGFSNEEIEESLKGDMIKASLSFAEKYAMHKVANQKQLKPPPKLMFRLIREGTIGDCPKCGSTTIKRFIWFGRSIGCIQPECENYHKRFKSNM